MSLKINMGGSDIEISAEMLEKAYQAKSAEELGKLLTEQGIEASDGETEILFEHLRSVRTSGELVDEELDDVAGGCGGEYVDPDYACPSCGSLGQELEGHFATPSLYMAKIQCPNCGNVWWNGIGRPMY